MQAQMGLRRGVYLVIPVGKLAAVHRVVQVDGDVGIDCEHCSVPHVNAHVIIEKYGCLSSVCRLFELAWLEGKHVAGVSKRQRQIQAVGHREANEHLVRLGHAVEGMNCFNDRIQLMCLPLQQPRNHKAILFLFVLRRKLCKVGQTTSKTSLVFGVRRIHSLAAQADAAVAPSVGGASHHAAHVHDGAAGIHAHHLAHWHLVQLPLLRPLAPAG